MSPTEFIDFFRDLPIWVKAPIEIIAFALPWLAYELHKAEKFCDRLIGEKESAPRSKEGSLTND